MCKAVQLLESDGEKQRRAKVWIALMRLLLCGLVLFKATFTA